MSKKTSDALRAEWTKKVSEYLALNDEYEILRTGANEISIPVVNAEGEDDWVVITIKVPSGSRDGEAYDGYALRDDYDAKVKANAAKVEEAARKKAEKIARDEKLRAQKAAQKAARNTEG